MLSSRLYTRPIVGNISASNGNSTVDYESQSFPSDGVQRVFNLDAGNYQVVFVDINGIPQIEGIHYNIVNYVLTFSSDPAEGTIHVRTSNTSNSNQNQSGGSTGVSQLSTTVAGTKIKLNYSVQNEPNVRPVINEANISGINRVGETLTTNLVDYTIFGNYNLLETRYQWYRSLKIGDGILIDGATSQDYVPTIDDVGFAPFCEITIVIDGGLNSESFSYPTRKVEPILPERFVGTREIRTNLGNNSVPNEAGYQRRDGDQDRDGNQISQIDEFGNQTGYIQTLIGNQNGVAGLDNSNAGIDDLRPGILGWGYRTNVSNANTKGIRWSLLPTDKEFDLYITSVARADENIGFTSQYRAVSGEGVSNYVNVDPVAQRANPQLILIGADLSPDENGELTLFYLGDCIVCSAILVEKEPPV